ncbi:MAG TPA: ABC transporter permease, partial [Chloroflexi bacterium]|nr:ABC transporter permease [Chloroflexota bacterium]
RSVLGVAWTMLNPFLTMVVLTVVFSQVFKFTTENYPVYVLSGIMAWNFFAGTTTSAMGEMVWGGGLLNRIYVPKAVFAVAALGTSAVNLFLSLIPLFVIAVALGVPLRPALWGMIPAVLVSGMFSVGVGLLLSTAVVYFADMLPVYDVVLTMWMYLTPIIYPLDILSPNLQVLFKLNPMYLMVEIFRSPLINGVVPGWDIWGLAILYAVVSLVVGGIIFTSRANEYVYRI